MSAKAQSSIIPHGCRTQRLPTYICFLSCTSSRIISCGIKWFHEKLMKCYYLYSLQTGFPGGLPLYVGLELHVSCMQKRSVPTKGSSCKCQLHMKDLGIFYFQEYIYCNWNWQVSNIRAYFSAALNINYIQKKKNIYIQGHIILPTYVPC